MTDNLEVLNKVVIALNELIDTYISEVFPVPVAGKRRRPPEDNDETTYKYMQKLTQTDRNIEYLLNCSTIDDVEYSDIKQALYYTVDAMKRFEYEHNGDITNMKRIRYKVEEINSIIRISSSHPASALKRLTLVTKVDLSKSV